MIDPEHGAGAGVSRRRRGPRLRAGTLVAGALWSATAGGEVVAQAACPEAAAATVEEGWVAYRAGDIEGAADRFEAAAARCPGASFARTGLGYARLRADRLVEAEALWSAVVGSDPDDVDAWVGLGLLAWRAGDPELAAERFERVRALDSGHPTALEYLDRIAALRGSRIVASAAPDAADRAWEAGDVDAALRLYGDRLAGDPGDRSAALRVALMQGWRGAYAEGLTLVDALLARYPEDHEARLARARLLAWSGDLPGATSEVGRVLRDVPDHPGALEALGLFGQWARDARGPVGGPDAASTISDPEIQVPPRVTSPSGEPSRAVWDALLRDDPDDVEARLGLAAALAATGAYDEALAQYDLIPEASAHDPRVLVERSRTLAWSGRLGDAERVARDAVRRDPGGAAGLSALGRALYWQGRNGAALEALEAAAAGAPTDPEIRDQLRSVRLLLAPTLRPRMRWEDDSDGATSLTSSVGAVVYAHPRTPLSAEVWYRRLGQASITAGETRRTVVGGSARLDFEAGGGWVASAGLGGSAQSSEGAPDLFSARAALASPRWRTFSGSVELVSDPILSTLATATGGVRSTEALLSGRWLSGDGWRVDGNLGVGAWNGSERNGRRSGSVVASRRWERFSLGAAARGFSFEKDLNDGYFDPDFYGIVELTSYWLGRTGPWTTLVEVAPGIQQVGRDGPSGSTLRGHVRVAYRWGRSGEIALAYRASSAGLDRVTTGTSAYRHHGLELGLDLVP